MSGLKTWLGKLFPSPDFDLDPRGPDRVREVKKRHKPVYRHEQDKRPVPIDFEVLVEYKVDVTCQRQHCGQRYQYRQERPEAGGEVGFCRCPVSDCCWLQTWMVSAWREHWSPYVGGIVGLITLLWAVPLFLRLNQQPFVWEGLPANTRLPPEAIPAIQEGIEALIPILGFVGGIAEGFLLSVFAGFLAYLFVLKLWNPNWRVSLLASKALRRLGMRPKGMPLGEDEIYLDEEQEEIEAPLPHFLLSDETILSEQPPDLSATAVDEVAEAPVLSQEGCAGPISQIAFVITFLALTWCRGVDLLAHLLGFVRYMITWCNDRPEVAITLENLRILMVSLLGTSTDPSQWPVLHAFWENPGRVIVALLLALLVGGAIDKKRRAVAFVIFLCFIAVILVDRGDLALPVGIGIPVIFLALWQAYRWWDLGAKSFSALQSLFGHLLTSQWFTDVRLFGRVLILVVAFHSSQKRQLGKPLLGLAYWAYRYSHWPRAAPGKAINQMQHWVEELEQLAGTELSAPEIVAVAHLRLARALRVNGQFDQALRHYEAVVELDRCTGGLTPTTLITAVMEQGDIWQVWGEYINAERCYQSALDQARQHGSIKIVAQAASRYAAWHVQQVDYVRQEVQRYQARADDSNQKTTLDYLAQLEHDHIHNALALYQEALNKLRSGFWKDRGFYEEQAECYLDMGDVYLKEGQSKEARRNYEESQTRFANTINREGRARALLGEGFTFWNWFDERSDSEHEQEEQPRWMDTLNRVDKAIKLFKRAARVSKRLGLPMLDISVQEALAMGHLASEDLSLASRNARRAIDIVECVQKNIFRESARFSYAESYAALYGIVVRAHIEQGDLCGAMEWMERARSRVLASYLGSKAKLELPAVNVPKSLLEQENMLLQQQAHLQRELVGGTSVGVRSIQERITELQKQLEQVWTELEQYYLQSQYVTKRRGQPLDWKGMAELMARQPVRCGVMQYFVCLDHLVGILLLPGEMKPRLIIKDFPACRLEALWRHKDEEKWWAPAPRKIFDDLINPLKYYLGGLDLLYILPYGLLHGLPLHIGRVGKKYLLERMPVAYVPSLTALSYLLPPDDYRTCLAVGYSEKKVDREKFERQAEYVAARFGTTAILGQEAKRQTLLSQMNEVDVIHLSCHGKFDGSYPLASPLHLADGALTPRQLMQETVGAKLAFLSSCEVGGSSVQGIDEPIGFPRALFYAGVPTVIAPSNEIDPDATTLLIQQFYTNLLDRHMHPARALQQAQLDLWKRERWADETYWAPLMLMGSGTNSKEEV